RRAAPLHEKVDGAAVLADVPDEQEVPSATEAPADPALVGDLRARARGARPRAVARAHPALGKLAEVSERRLAGRQRVLREAVAEVLQREAQAQRELARVGEGVGEIVEEARHVRAALEGALAVRLEQPAGAVEIGLLADAREDVGELPA